MSLRDFLDAAHALLVDNLRGQGVGLVEALEASQETRAGMPVDSEKKVDEQNARSVQELEQLMRGLK